MSTTPNATTSGPALNANAAALQTQAQDDLVIWAHKLSKRFKIYREPWHRIPEWLTNDRINKHEDFWAVRNVSFQIRKGQCLGVIGTNGSGKSTLLKMITGALSTTEGECGVRGRVLSMIELGAGLNPHLTGRQNVFNAAMLLNFPPQFARDKIAEIEEFAELGEFFDRPFRLYSSGMKVRIAFSMFASFRPTVLLVDEALSVGDVFFQQKCMAKLREMLDDDLTMMFVSHSTDSILNLCDRVLLIEHGRQVFLGDSEEGVSRYLASMRGSPASGRQAKAKAKSAPKTVSPRQALTEQEIIEHDRIGNRALDRHGAGGLVILAARVRNQDGRDSTRALVGQTIRFDLLLESRTHIHSPAAGLRLFDRFGNRVFAAGTKQLGHELPAVDPGERLIVTFELTLEISPGEYTFGLGTSEPDADDPTLGYPHDRIDRLGPIIVGRPHAEPPTFFGTARLPLKTSHTRVTSGQTAIEVGNAPREVPTSE